MAPPARIDLSGQRVLVTGAGRGLGRGMAEAFAAWGASVGVADLAPGGVAETLERVRRPGASFWGGTLDVADEASVEKAVGLCCGALGGIDLLVNNAGVLSVSPVVDLTLAEWRRVMEVNATGVFLMSRAVVRHMIAARQPGSVVSISSIAGKRGDPGLAHYSASKFAVIGFTQALAREVARHGIMVNALCPGVVETPMIDDLSHAASVPIAEWLAHQAIGRSQTPEDIAFAAAFLHRSRSMTGQSLNIDGGTLFH